MPNFAQSQKLLALDKSNRIKRIRFYEGDQLRLKLVDENFIRQGTILLLKDSSFIFNDVEIPLNQIKFIVAPQHNHGFQLLYHLSIRGGIGYFVLDGGNRLINGERPIVDDRTFNVSLPLLASAAIFRFFGWKRHYINRRNRLQILDLSI